MSRPIGSKSSVALPSSYERGHPAVNFYLAILAQSVKDTRWHYAKIMWADFQGAELYQGVNKDPLQIAWWICKYVKERICD